MAYSKRDQVGPPKPKRRGWRDSEESKQRREKWRRERDMYLGEHDQCQFWEYVTDSRVFEYPAHSGGVEVHHIKPRSLGGTRGETGPLVTLCRAHHRFVEEHRIEARELGLLIRRTP